MSSPTSLHLPPADLQAERRLIGDLLADNGKHAAIQHFFHRAFFLDPTHKRIYIDIRRRLDAGQPADADAVKAEYEQSCALDEIGGAAYLGQLVDAAVGGPGAANDARAVYDAWLRRQLIGLGSELLAAGYDCVGTPVTVERVEAAESRLSALSALRQVVS